MEDHKKYKAGITVKEPWSAEISYEMLDMTLYAVENGGDGCSYTALVPNQGVTPGTDPTVWTKSSQAGQSIYDLAVKYGHFEGTEEEFEAQYQAALAAANSAASAASATDASIQAAESVRVSNETARETAEVLRSQAEGRRVDAENLRVSAESARALAEGGRASAESARVSAESERASAETARQTAEGIRDAGEQARVRDFAALETDMETAIRNVDAKAAEIEQDIVGYEANEAARVLAEAGRVSAESGRVSAESGRVSAESGRVSAESGRVSAETARATAESGRASAETGRVSAEQGRVNAESARVVAETARESQASTDHAAAVEATEAANTAAAAADAAREGIQEDLEQKANIDGYYENMGVGTAKNLEGRSVVTESFLARTTGGDADVSNGPAQMQGMKGESVKWNQLVQNGDFSDGTTGWSGCTVENGIATRTETNVIQKSAAYYPQIISGHKYLLLCDMKRAGETAMVFYFGGGGSGEYLHQPFGSAPQNSWVTNSAIWTSTYTGAAYVQVRGGAGDQIKNFHIHDLTAIFGSGNEPSTVEEFEAWLAATVGLQPYYAYDPGSVVNVKMTGLESIGRNLLDPATGKAVILGEYSDVYGNYYGITGTHGAITFTDAMGSTETITPDSDGKFLLETPGTLTVATPGDDCSVFLWWDGSKTDYSPYERNVANLDVTHIWGRKNGTGDRVRVWPTGVPGFNGLKDELKVEDGQTAAKRVVGEVDLGTLAWTYNDTYNAFISASPTPKPIAAYVGLCSRYPFVGSYFNRADKTAFYIFNDRVSIQDSAYSDAATFTTAMSGVLLYYELETPETYTDLVYQDSPYFPDGTPVALPVTYQEDNWGIERVLPVNEGAVLTAKPTLSVLYSIDAVETLDTHTKEIADLYDGLDELDAKKPEKNGSYPEMSVGSAKTLAGNSVSPAEYTFRKTGGGNKASGLAMVEKVKGKSVVWNQLIQNGNFVSTDVWEKQSGVEMTVSDNVATLTYDGSNYQRIFQYHSFVANHKYLVAIDIKSPASLLDTAVFSTIPGAIPTRINDNYANIWHKYSTVFTAAASGQYQILYASIQTLGTSGTAQVRNAQAFDLTLMFGAGNEPSTVAEFEALYPLPYYAYNAGTIVNNAAEAIESVGFNQLKLTGRTEYSGSGTPTTKYDFLTENMILKGFSSNGYFSSETVASYSVTENSVTVKTGVSGNSGSYGVGFPMRVLPDTDYYFFAIRESSPANIAATWIDGAGNIISYSSNSNNVEFHSPAIAAWCIVNFRPGAVDTQKSWSNICINLSDAARNGTYEPYKHNDLALNLPTLTGKLNGEGESVVIFPDGLRSAGTAYDELIVENGYAVGAVRRIGSVDLGTLGWTYDQYNVFHTNLPSDVKKIGSSSILPAWLLSSLYTAVKRNQFDFETVANLTMAMNSSQVLTYFKNSAYSNAATFKTAMSGVMLYYELATPELYVLDTPIYMAYQEDGGGTERRLPEDTASSVLAPFSCEMNYPIDAVSVINSLPHDYISTASMDAFLSALGTAMGGTWTKTWDATNQKWTFSFSSNS